VVAVGVVAVSLASCSNGSSPTSTTTAPASFSVLIGAGIHLLRQGNTNAAEQLFQQAIARNPNNALGYYDLGVVYQQQGQTDSAEREYTAALGVNPNYVPALYNKALMDGSQRPFLAIALYEKAISIQPDSPTALLHLGLLEATVTHQKPAGLSDLRKAIRLDPALRADIPASLRAQLNAPQAASP
jgi:tetratricopeptide (TPR) repeat protein